MKYFVEARLDYQRDTFFWVVGLNEKRVADYKESLFTSLVDLSDWVLRHNPLVIVPLDNEPIHGHVFRDLSLISPDKFTCADGVLGCNAGFVKLAAPTFYQLLRLFQSDKPEGKEFLQKLSDEERLLIGGLF